jgi:hypothetical protein
MFRRWAENRIYRNTLRVAVNALREAARTPDPLRKLHLLDLAEQKLRDASWLKPELATERYRPGLEEIARSRDRALKEQALPAVAKLLQVVEQGVGDRKVLLAPAGELLAFLFRYLPDHPEAQALGARFRQLGGEQRPYRPIPALSEMYHRPEAAAGCGTLIGGLIAVLALAWCLHAFLP